MRNRFISLLLGAALVFAPISTTSAQSVSAEDRSSYPSASDVLSKGSAACRAEQGQIIFTLKTFAVVMSVDVGFLDVKIEYTDDGKAWTVEKELGDMVEHSGNEQLRHSVIDGYAVQVEGGHYYRVTCEHYVFGYSVTNDVMAQQTAHDFSRAVWVPRAPAVTSETTAQPEAVQTTSAAAVTTSAAAATTSVTSVSAVTPATAKSTTAPAATTTGRGSVSAQSTAAAGTAETSSPATGGKPPVIPLVTAAISYVVLLTLRKKRK